MSAPKPLQIHIANDPIYYQNGMVLYFRDGGPCWIIDPGLPPQAPDMLQHLRAHRLEAQAIVLTHAHADHIAGIDEIRDELGSLPVYLGREEWPALTDPMQNLSGLMGPGLTTGVRDPHDLPHGSTLTLDGVVWSVVDVSGHSPGGRALYSADCGVVVVGDALFCGSIGRVDFPHSNGGKLLRNIRNNLLSLPDETRVLPGHGPETTIGEERRTNPFLAGGL